jgi:hypothetical protein
MMKKLYDQNAFDISGDVTGVRCQNTIYTLCHAEIETFGVPKGGFTVSKLCTKCQATAVHLELACNVVYIQCYKPIQLCVMLMCSKYRMRYHL